MKPELSAPAFWHLTEPKLVITQSGRQKYDFFKRPNVVGQTTGHSWRDPQRLVDSGEVVMHGVNRN